MIGGIVNLGPPRPGTGAPMEFCTSYIVPNNYVD